MPIHVKICGLRTVPDLEAALAAGADAIGLVFAKESPRYVDAGRAAELLAHVPRTVKCLAVFAHADEADVEAIRHLPFDGLQAESLSVPLEDLPRNWFYLPAVRNTKNLEESASTAEGETDGWDDALLLDGPHGGGKGTRGDWDRAARLAKRRPIVLAGGLTPDNVAEAIQRVRPFAVDVSSGVERERGVKDPERIQRFVHNVRQAIGAHDDVHRA